MSEAVRTLQERIPATKVSEDQVLELFLDWVTDTGLEPYPAQEEAFMEVMAGNHVILNTPTGSGKSLVALAVHFKALCEHKTSYYTSPIKALVSEKFFELCAQLGAENVGMLTGDASINRDASIVCCTAEILSNLALREGVYAKVDYVVMDEFHYFSDPDRGIAWQIPLLALRDATFMLMSATLGNIEVFREQIEQYTGREVAWVHSSERPVPLDYTYSETNLHETIAELAEAEKTPIYVVNFTQREAAEQAQNLMSVNLCTKPEKQAIAKAIGDFRFDSAFGKDVHRYLKHGVGIHHAGLLPKYRMLVERLSQQGLLKIISGTDTLGVGVNVPIRSVLFTKLCKYDGQGVRILTVRDFKQIGGRAGRRGFDTQGSIVAQAPEHMIENKKLENKAAAAGKKKFNRKKPPERGYVHWDEKTFRTLIDADPEPLSSQFSVSHGLLLSVLSREIDSSALHGGYARVVELIGRSYERPGARRRLRRQAALLFKDLRNAGVVELVPKAVGTRTAVRVSEGLQRDFSLHHTLSMFLLEALESLDPEAEGYTIDLISYVEAILENPSAVVRRQLDFAKTELVNRLKAEGMEYDQRMEALEEVDYPKPCANDIYLIFDRFRAKHPWVSGENVRPKSIARDMYERFANFNEYVKIYGLARSEGVLLRYLTQAYKALIQTVPSVYKDEVMQDVVAYLRATLARVDSTLVKEWEQMVAGRGDDEQQTQEQELGPADPAADVRAFKARIRAEMHALVRALSKGDLEEAVLANRAHDEAWESDAFETALESFTDECGPLVFDHSARLAQYTHVTSIAPRTWQVRQTLCNAEGETPWMIEAEIDLPVPTFEEPVPDGPLVRVVQMI